MHIVISFVSLYRSQLSRTRFVKNGVWHAHWPALGEVLTLCGCKIYLTFTEIRFDSHTPRVSLFLVSSELRCIDPRTGWVFHDTNKFNVPSHHTELTSEPICLTKLTVSREASREVSREVSHEVSHEYRHPQCFPLITCSVKVIKLRSNTGGSEIPDLASEIL